MPYGGGFGVGRLIGTRSDELDKKATKTYKTVKPSVPKTSENRSIEQFNLIVGPKIYLINSGEAKWNRISLCGTKDRGYIAGATINQTNATRANAQRVLIFDIRNHMLQINDAASDAISDQLPPRRGQNNIATSCKYKSFTVITEDPTQGIYHKALADTTLAIVQYMAASYSVVNGTFAGRA